MSLDYTNKLYKIVHFVSSSAVENPRYISTALDMRRIQLNYIEIVFVITYKIRLVAKPDGFFYAFFEAERIGFFVVIVHALQAGWDQK